jgi:hypothetical protein
LTASEDWAKKTKVKVRITNREMMSLWMPAMIDVVGCEFVQQGELEGEGTGSGTGCTAADGNAEKAGARTPGPWHLRRDCHF